jgi:hypothetical protein
MLRTSKVDYGGEGFIEEAIVSSVCRYVSLLKDA